MTPILAWFTPNFQIFVYLCYPKPMDDWMIINFPKMTTFIWDPSSILSQKSLHFHSVGYIHMKLSILTGKPHKIVGFSQHDHITTCASFESKHGNHIRYDIIICLGNLGVPKSLVAPQCEPPCVNGIFHMVVQPNGSEQPPP